MGTSYYRLKQANYDGQFTYSSMKTVNLESSDEVSITIYPNPADNIMTIEASNSDQIGLDEISVYDLYGRNNSSLLEKMESTDGKSVLDISKLSSGIYVIKVKNTVTRVVVK
jgi:L-cysteine desulfidase